MLVLESTVLLSQTHDCQGHVVCYTGALFTNFTLYSRAHTKSIKPSDFRHLIPVIVTYMLLENRKKSASKTLATTTCTRGVPLTKKRTVWLLVTHRMQPARYATIQHMGRSSSARSFWCLDAKSRHARKTNAPASKNCRQHPRNAGNVATNFGFSSTCGSRENPGGPFLAFLAEPSEICV